MCRKRLFLIIFILFLFLILPLVKTLAQSACVTANDPCKDLSPQDKVACYEKNVSVCQQESDSLSSQVEAFNSSIAVTNLKISQTEQQIENLTKEIAGISTKINNLESSLTTLSNVLIERIIASYKNSSHNNLGLLLFNSSKLANLLVNLQYLQIVQKNDQKILFAVETTKINYGQQKQLREEKKAVQEQLQVKLASQKSYLNQQKKSKETLLSATQNSQQVWSSLLARARAQLAAIQSFVSSQGGASILSNQTVCNDWGCYYNQRDNNWANNQIGISQQSIREVGCLVSDVAMILSHYGKRDITPADVASTFDAFVPGTAYMWFRPWSIKGATVNRSGQAVSTATIDSQLLLGQPVIVGIGAGPAHFVVLKSGSNGNYIMNDPFLENGHDVKFSDHYSISSISEVDYVSIN